MTITVTVNAGGGADHTSLQAAITALPAPAGWADDYEVLIQDSATYSYATGLVVAVAATVHPLVVRAAAGQTPTVTNTAAGRACTVSGSEYVTFENITFVAIAGTACLGAPVAAADLMFTGCSFSSNIVAVSADSGLSLRPRWTFTDCTINCTGGFCIQGKNMADAVLTSCTFETGGTAMTMDLSANMKVDRCRFEALTNTGLNITSSASVVFTNNIFDQCTVTNNFLKLGVACPGALIANNTWHVVTNTAAACIQLVTGATTCTIKNNVFRTNTVTQACIQVTTVEAATLVSDYNIFYKTNDANLYVGKVNITSYDLAGWQGLGYDANSQFLDPNHADEAAGDYTPASSNAATVDAGTLVAVTTDYAGTTRPQGAAYDVGAYEFTVPAVTGSPSIEPGTDTILGGAAVAAADSNDLADKALDEDLLGALPAGWTTTHVGAGLYATSALGMELRTTAAAGDVARLVTDGANLHFDVRVTAQVLMATGTCDCAALEVTTATHTYRNRLRLVGGVYILIAEALSGALVIAKGVQVLGTVPSAELRVVLGEGHAWGFAGSQAYALTVSGLGNQAKTIRIWAGNDAAAGGVVRTRFTDYEVRSAATIGGRLLEETTFNHPRRIEGLVPAAPLEDVGLVEVSVFGPWGYKTSADAFEYTLPNTLTLKGGIGAIVLPFDPQIRSN